MPREPLPANAVQQIDTNLPFSLTIHERERAMAAASVAHRNIFNGTDSPHEYREVQLTYTLPGGGK